jgi:hypothetical protein
LTNRNDDFDGYRKWLNITTTRRPPSHYELLGVKLDEDDHEVIQAAVEQRRNYVESKRGQGKDELVAEIVMRIDEAGITLLNGEMRRDYDWEMDLFEKRRKNRQVDPFTSRSRVKSRPSRTVGEDGGIVKTFAGIMAVVCVGFGIMAWFSFQLPWAKAPKESEVVQAPVVTQPPVVDKKREEPVVAPKVVVADKKNDADTVHSNPGEISRTEFVPLFDGKTLNGWRMSQFGGEGRAKVEGDQITLRASSNGSTGITWSGDFPKNNYEVIVEAKRVNGNDFFCGMTFPVGDSSCSLIVGGWGGSVVGLSSIDGKDASQNQTTTKMNFENGRWYTIRLLVTASAIQSWIDDAPVIDLPREGRTFSIRKEIEPSRPLGIASWKTSAALKNIKWRVVLPQNR